MNCRCGAVTAEGIWLCSGCSERFEYRLAEVDAVLTELAHAIPRLTLTATYGDRTPGVRAQHAPAPVNVDAVSAMDALHRWLMGTALRLAEVTRRPLQGRTPFDLEYYLRANMPRLRSLSWVTDLHDALDGLLKDCERVTHDGNTARVILGPCETVGCGETLTAHEGDHEARCQVCSQTYNIRDYRENRAHSALGHDGTPLRASQAVRYLNSKGIKVSTKDVENWVKWGSLSEADTDDKGRRLYRIEDIYARATRNTA